MECISIYINMIIEESDAGCFALLMLISHRVITYSLRRLDYSILITHLFYTSFQFQIISLKEIKFGNSIMIFFTRGMINKKY